MSELDWHKVNDHYLQAALDRIRRCLQRTVERCDGADAADAADAVDEEEKIGQLDSEQDEELVPALVQLSRSFGLSSFEHDVLVLAAGPELDPGFDILCAAAQGRAERCPPSFGLALSALPEAHWDALAPDSTLRFWRLLEVEPGPTLTGSALRIEERVLHYLRGLESGEEKLTGLLTPLKPSGSLVPSYQSVAEQLTSLWARASGQGPLPVVQLCGVASESKRVIAAASCAALGIGVVALSVAALPLAIPELHGFVRLLNREMVLGRWALLLECAEMEARDTSRDAAINTFAVELRGALLISSRERRPIQGRLTVPLDVGRPEAAEQAALWQAVLGEIGLPVQEGDGGKSSLNGHIDRLTAQFDLSPDAIRAAGFAALGQRTAAGDAVGGTEAGDTEAGTEQQPEGEILSKFLWQACLGHTRPGLDALAQRIRPVAGWDDLVLPGSQMALLREIAVHVRQRHRVYEQWGFAAHSSRGLGITSLFAGPSGTGKTMAAEVLASELTLDLYRIDLAAVVSKYIGETEKNLKRIFDAADAGGAILLFDEADALFGKRSEVKDSHDRYANIEVSYLLQRMEEYRGVAILTTNLKNALDLAFLRRLRFIVQFPFPEAEARAEIWRRIFPPQTPTEGLDAVQLARLSVTGGNIRNIALGAAFLAAEDGTSVGMEQVLRAARSEYAKLEQPLTAVEIGGKYP